MACKHAIESGPLASQVGQEPGWPKGTASKLCQLQWLAGRLGHTDGLVDKLV